VSAAAIRAAAVMALFCGMASSQDPLERVKTALAGADRALARTALLELLAAELPDRNRTVSESLAVFRDAGAADDWLQAAERWTGAHPDDAMIHFYRGTTWQALKHLGRAEEALAKAHALAPKDPGVQYWWAWNAALRFDPTSALDRSREGSFDGAETFRKEQQDRVAAEPTATRAIVCLLGAVLLIGTIAMLRRV
jgi:tetratricopeptide (TPR) repeat protein